MFTLEGRTCVMSGATGYDGSGAVRHLCASGMNVVMLTHMVEAAEELRESLGEAQRHCFIQTENESYEALYAEVESRFGSVDVVIPNQGAAMVRSELNEISADFFRERLNHQIVHGFEMFQAAVPFLERSKAGRIILMSSSGARDGLAEEFLCDSVARGGVISMTYSLARELAPKGITVNCIAKGGFPSGWPRRRQTNMMQSR